MPTGTTRRVIMKKSPWCRRSLIFISNQNIQPAFVEDTPLPHTLAKPRSCFFSSLPCVVSFLRSWVPPAPCRCVVPSLSLSFMRLLSSQASPQLPPVVYVHVRDSSVFWWCLSSPSRHTRRRSAGAAAGSVSGTSSAAAAWRHQRRLLRHTDVRAHINTVQGGAPRSARRTVARGRWGVRCGKGG
jgi:hypothetical protein